MILDPFKGKNHYRYGKKLSEEVKLKIIQTLKNKIVSEETKKIIFLDLKKKVYCYDALTKKFIISYDGIRIMQREFNLKSISSIQRKIDQNNIFSFIRDNQKRNWILISKPLE